MIKFTSKARLFLSLAAICAVGFPIQADELENQLTEIYRKWVPAHIEAGAVRVNKIEVDKKKKTVTVYTNETGSYFPYTKENVQTLKSAILAALPVPENTYKLNIFAGNTSVDELALGVKRYNPSPKEKNTFIERTWTLPAPAGLDGANIAVWQSHGWYFEKKLNRWEWQRARILQTVEDLYTQSYVMPFLMPMLENAGAYVMSPRERDVQLFEAIVDPDGEFAYSEGYIENNGKYEWIDGGEGFGYINDTILDGDNPFKNGRFRKSKSVKNDSEASAVIYAADIPEQGDYAVYVSYATLPNSSVSVPYTVHTLAGDKTVNVNQKMGGGTWIYLGHFPLAAGKNPVVTLKNISKGKNDVVTADAVKIGGGVGNVARMPLEPLDSIDYKPIKSGYPRFTEGARYFMQWAGMPDSVYSPQNHSNDYTDDYQSRGIWVNYLSGGSSVNPRQKGLGIPIDLSLAWHTDAGTTMNDSIIGTLGIYSTDNGNSLGNGGSRLASREFTDMVMTQIVDDIRAQFEPDWTRRGMWDKAYSEARLPLVPSMLLELLSHQNFADMKYGLDPTFRFTVSRAVYKAMLKFIANRDGRAYVVQPLPVRSFGINSSADGKTFKLSWKETVDSLESTATPTYYIVEKRTNSGGFYTAAITDKPEWTFNDAKADSIYSFRIIAGNDGGVSFPSEILALGVSSRGGEEVTVVNGFTRISAPDWFEAGEIAGFLDFKDHGVPYLQDISFIGSQFEFRREIPWMDDDAAGFGASRANYEKDVIAGNTFDYPYIHGQAILAAGHSFISSGVESFCENNAEPKIVDLILGKQKETPIGRGIMGTRYKTFTPELQDKLEICSKNGSDILVTGSYVATDLWDNNFSSAETMEKDKKFAQDVLGFTWRVGQAATIGAAYQVPVRFKSFTGGEYTFDTELNADSYAVESPDSFYETDPTKATTLMRYNENNLIAAIAMDAGNYRTVVIGFPFEVIKEDSAKNSLMKQILNFFSK